MTFYIKKPEKRQRYYYTKADGTRGWKYLRFCGLNEPKPHSIAIGSIPATHSSNNEELVARYREVFALFFPETMQFFEDNGIILKTVSGYNVLDAFAVWFSIEGSRRKLQKFIDEHGSHVATYFSYLRDTDYARTKSLRVWSPEYDINSRRLLEKFLPHKITLPTNTGWRPIRQPFETKGPFAVVETAGRDQFELWFRYDRDAVLAKLTYG